MNISTSETAKIEGYPKLAELQGMYPQLATYGRFATLNTRNLLYLQAELVDLEERLDRYTLEDLRSTEDQQKGSSRDWYTLSKIVDGVSSSQWEVMLEIRQRLEQYNACLLQQ
ncbi:hypothetical protein BKA65DRAFT_600032 [Rhexocercosporidium sp. MPI-PUGE-AT-0058]|nr:hypothetical protein BKA65DRAFT_600032 [Rhexocercosporidium sp. MPI-PUGE-AT-0058]